MSFMPDDDAVHLGQYLRSILEKEAPENVLRDLMDSDEEYDPRLWSLTANQLGVHGVSVPETFGGSGAGLPALGVCFEELGRALVCAPFLSTVAIASTSLARIGTAAAADLLSLVVQGTSVVAAAGFETVSSSRAITTRNGLLDGAAAVVIDGFAADAILVAARDDAARTNLYLVHAPFSGVQRERLNTLDTTRRLARITFEAAPADLVATEARAIVDQSLDTGWLLLAAEQLGGAQRVLEMAVAYAKERVQFGRPIGSFQAVKHCLADMLVRVESTRSVVYHALHQVEADPTSLPVEAAVARAIASDAFLTCATANLQVHGGIGFTWEHSAHLYLKRAKSSSLLFGGPAATRRELARRLELVGGVS
jgi:alkylation response protein AidB-like acyl-CoA dehydrogenase